MKWLGDENAGKIHEKAMKVFNLTMENIYPLSSVKRGDFETHECVCAPGNDENCLDINCLNFATYTECTIDKCVLQGNCKNHRLQTKDFLPVQIVSTRQTGYGLISLGYAKKNDLVSEYTGEIIDQKELDHRLATLSEAEHNFYYYMLETNKIVDARIYGGMSRFCNHSCEPNCTTEKWMVNGELRAAVIAIKNIKPGDPVTFNYQWKTVGTGSAPCYCGAKSCVGTIGADGDKDKCITPTGVFREPRPGECGMLLVHRKIRLWCAVTNRFKIGFVNDYRKENDQHCIEYEDKDEGRDSTEWMELSKKKWHLFVDLTGKSQSEVRNLVFSIPKLQRKQRDAVPLSTPDTTRVEPIAQIPATRIVLPGNAPSNDSAVVALRGVSMKWDKPAITKVLQSHTTASMNISLAMLANESQMVIIKTKNAEIARKLTNALRNAKVFDPRVRIFQAEEDTLNYFERLLIKPKTVRKYNPAKEDLKGTVQPKSRSYMIGKCFNWTLTRTQIKNAPGKNSGRSSKLDASLRHQAFEIIETATTLLKLEKSVFARAVLIEQLYNILTTYDINDNKYVISACLLISAKANGSRFDESSLLSSVCHGNLNPSSPELLALWRRKAAEYESRILKMLNYDTLPTSPYDIIRCIDRTPENESLTRFVKSVIRHAIKNAMYLEYSCTLLSAAILYVCVARKEHSNGKVPRWLPPIEYLESAGIAKVFFDRAVPDVLNLINEDEKSPIDDTHVIKLCNAWFQHRKPKIVLEAIDIPIECYPVVHFEQLEAKVETGYSSYTSKFPSNIDSKDANRDIYIHPVPYQSSERAKSSNDTASILKELHIMQKIRGAAHVMNCLGVVLPSKGKKENEEPADLWAMDAPKESGHQHFLVFDQPQHNFAGLIQSGIEIPAYHLQNYLKDIVHAVAECHEHGIAHRWIATNNAFVYGNKAKLGGFSYSRILNSSGYGKLSKYEIAMHHKGRLMPISAPEILLGMDQYHTSADLWALGCLMASMLLRRDLFAGSNAKSTLDRIFKLCGSPRLSTWPMVDRLPGYDRNAKTYKNRMRKTLLERCPNLKEDALEVLESLLQLIPENRMSARNVLKLPFFARGHVESPHVDIEKYALLSPKFSQKNKYHVSIKGQPASCAVKQFKNSNHNGWEAPSAKKRRAEY